MQIGRLACLSALTLACAGAMAQSVPSKPITIIVPNPPGGVVDSSARLAGDPLTKLLGQAVVIENRGGASGNIAYQQVALAPKDGYTLLASYSAYQVGNPTMFAKLPWDQKEPAPVALIAAATNVITVDPSVPANNLKDLIAYLKANPGKVNFAPQGNDSLSHVGTALFEQQTQTDMVHVSYKGSGAAIQDLLGGQVQMFMTTPQAVINQLSEQVKKALELPETKQRAATLGIEVRYLGPDALAALVKKDTECWGSVIKSRNITAD